MENIKNSFENVKKDIQILQRELYFIKKEFSNINERLFDFSKIIENFYSELNTLKSSHNQINNKLNNQLNNSTNQEVFSTNRQTNSTDKSYFKPLNDQNQGISIGNKGVSTNRQTDKQTDQQTNIPLKNLKPMEIDKANDLLESLDNFKEELKIKFKNLTDQEILVFSTIYQLEEEKGYSNYKSLSSKLNLSESSIRDYVRRLLNKGIPLEKNKVNNKEIKLNISQNLKKIASLDSILRIRNL
jgi:predicted transcriptional regulator